MASLFFFSCAKHCWKFYFHLTTPPYTLHPRLEVKPGIPLSLIQTPNYKLLIWSMLLVEFCPWSSFSPLSLFNFLSPLPMGICLNSDLILWEQSHFWKNSDSSLHPVGTAPLQDVKLTYHPSIIILTKMNALGTGTYHLKYSEYVGCFIFRDQTSILSPLQLLIQVSLNMELWGIDKGNPEPPICSKSKSIIFILWVVSKLTT